MLRTIIELSEAQLVAYNRRDLEAFCACFTEDVRVVDEACHVTIDGGAAFRARYAELFGKWSEIGGVVLQRMVLGPHVVEHESYYRKDAEGVVRESGEVIVRYTKRDNGGASKIAMVEFLRG
jgi:hypothetical protein